MNIHESRRDDLPAIDRTSDIDTSSEANVIQTSDPAMTTLMASMMTNMEAMMLRLESNEKNTWYDGNQRGRGRGRTRQASRGRGRNAGRGQFTRNVGARGDKYCHTHGNCAHSSAERQTPGDIHKNTATFINMMGGNNYNCE